MPFGCTSPQNFRPAQRNDPRLFSRQISRANSRKFAEMCPIKVWNFLTVFFRCYNRKVRALLPQNQDFSTSKPTTCKNGPRFWKKMVKKPLPIANPLLEVFSFGGYPESNRFFRFFGEFSKNLRFLQKFLGDLPYRALLPQNRDFFHFDANNLQTRTSLLEADGQEATPTGKSCS